MSQSATLPAGRLLGWYGDDFTGAAAVLEVMAFAGIDSVLFLQPPTEDQLAHFPDARAIGIAGTARARSPEWMAAHLPAIFETMASQQAAINHYKICSTLDSSPHIGSIGKAAELAIPILGSDWHSLLVAAPAMQRYQVFGNLFAGIEGEVHRLDRHPVMSRHPVTPMHEADVCRHLAAQTALSMGLVNIVDLDTGQGDISLQHARDAGASVIAFDCLHETSLAEVGRLVWSHRGKRHFSLSSQGLEYALVAHWREAGLLDDTSPPPSPGSRDRILVVSGSCSPITARQIAVAEDQGFAGLRIDPCLATDDTRWQQEIERVRTQALHALDKGLSPLVYTSRGPDDPANAHFEKAIATADLSSDQVNERVGTGLGRLLLSLIEASGVMRCVIAGGDTSGHGASCLGLYALTALSPISTGASLCQAHTDTPALNGLQIALKGGQMGTPDFFEQVRLGGQTTIN